MMEKDFNKQELDKLISDWTDELLHADIADRITDSLLDFVENDDTEIDGEGLLDLHIHELAMEENMTRRRKWRIFISSVAATSIVILILTAAFLTKQSSKIPAYHQETLAVEDQVKMKPIVMTRETPETIADSASMTSGKTAIKEPQKVIAHTTHKINPVKNEILQEATPELILIETLAELNEGLATMADNTKESLRMTNASLLPVNLMSDDNETDLIENTLINTLYEIRNLNIDLNFETDNNITTEI